MSRMKVRRTCTLESAESPGIPPDGPFHVKHAGDVRVSATVPHRSLPPAVYCAFRVGRAPGTDLLPESTALTPCNVMKAKVSGETVTPTGL